MHRWPMKHEPARLLGMPADIFETGATTSWLQPCHICPNRAESDRARGEFSAILSGFGAKSPELGTASTIFGDNPLNSASFGQSWPGIVNCRPSCGAAARDSQQHCVERSVAHGCSPRHFRVSARACGSRWACMWLRAVVSHIGPPMAQIAPSVFLCSSLSFFFSLHPYLSVFVSPCVAFSRSATTLLVRSGRPGTPVAP